MPNLLFFDTETTGMADFKAPPSAKHQPHIIQMAMLLTTANGSEITRASFLIRPDGWTVSKQAADVHHITTEACADLGIDIWTAAAILSALLDQDPPPLIVAHNADFDRFMLNIEAERNDILFDKSDWYCTMRAATDILKLPGRYGNFKWPSLTETHKHFFGADFEGKHDAMGDVLACKACYFKIMEALKAQDDQRTPEDKRADAETESERADRVEREIG
jgi:DNA polymerase III subunit epsilon